MWSEIFLEFGEDETINFGPRDEQSEGKNIYQSRTIATISSENKVQTQPVVVSCATADYIALGVDSKVIIFGSECKEVVFTLPLESKVNSIEVNENYPLLLVGEQNGLLHLVHISSQLKLLSVSLVPSEFISSASTFKSIFFSSEDENGNCWIVILCEMNRLYLFSQLHIKTLCETVECGTLDIIPKVLAEIERKDIDISLLNSDFSARYAFSLFGFDNDIVSGFCGEGDFALGFQTKDEIMSLLPSDCFKGRGEVKKAQSTRNGRYIIVLDDTKQLYLVCPITLIVINVCRIAHIEDFMLLDYANCDKSDSKIATLISSESSCWFQMWSFPFFDPIYSLRVSEYAVLVQASSQESVFIVEGLKKNDSDEFVSTLRIRIIEDSLPERRLLHLIYKRKFDEAENFAKLFSLDIEDVHKARISFYLNTISPWRMEKLDDNIKDSLDNLKTSLQQISDKEYVVCCCLQATLPSLKSTKEFLLFAKDTCSQIKGDKKDKFLLEINHMLHRLVTFQLLYEDTDWTSWFKFCRGNVIDEFLLLLNSNKISKAFYLWERHQDEISHQLNDTIIEKILHCIPATLPSTYLGHFLEESFLPNILHNLPDTMEIVAKWLLERVQLMEITEKTDWPQNGINLLELLSSTCEKLLHLYNKGGLGISSKLNIFALQHKLVNSDTYISRLLHMIKDLKSLAVLRIEFGCHLTLSEFCLEDKASVMFLILDRLSGEEKMKRAMNKFLYSYMEENMLDEQILVKYVKDIIEFSQCGWWYWEEAPWEEKVLSVIACIHDAICKLDSVILVLSQAPLPWSPGIDKLFQEAYALSHKRKAEFDIEKQRVKLKMVVLKYDLRSYNIVDIRRGQRLVNYILQLNKPEVMNDALEVVNSYPHLSDIDAYLFRMRFLLRTNQQEEFADLINSIPHDKALLCNERFLYFVREFLESSNSCNDEDTNSYKARLKAGVIYVLRYLQRIDTHKQNLYEENLLLFQRCLNLHMEFGISVPLSSITSLTSCHDILLQEINNFISEEKYFGNTISDEFKQDKQMKTYGSIYRLGELLEIPREKVLADLALRATRTGQVDTAIDLIRKIPIDCNLDYSQAAFNLVDYLIKNMQNIEDADAELSDLPLILHRLLSHSLAYCKPKMLQVCLDYCHWTSFLSHLQNLTPKHNFYLSGLKMDRYHQWKFSPFFLDRGLRVSISHILPVLGKCLAFHVSSKLQDGNHNFTFHNFDESILEFFQNGKLLAKILRDKSQEDATLRIIIKFIVAYIDICSSTDPIKKINVDTLMTTHWAPLLKDIAITLLPRILTAAQVDLTAALGVICVIDEKETLSIFKLLEKKSANDFKYLMALSSLGMIFSHLKCLGNICAHYESIHTKSLWGLRLQEHTLSFQDILSPLSRQEKYHLLNELVQKTCVTVETIQEYCSAFNIDLDEALVNYLKALLVRSEIMQSMGEITDAFTLSKKMNSIFIQAEKIISLISNPLYLAEKLIYLADEVDSYCYEVLLFLKSNKNVLCYCSEDIKYNIERDIEVLQFLESYNRINKPSEYERSCWLSCHSQSDDLPPVSSKRLPFHPLIRREQIWKIIDNELSVTTINMWLSISSPLKISSDDLLLLTVQKTISSWAKCHNDSLYSPLWSCNVLDCRLFAAVQELISQIANPSKAIACITWILNNLPSGPTKVLIVKKGIELAEKWIANSDNACHLRPTIQKLTVIYHKLATEDILHTHGLGISKYISVSNQPAQLINSIWEDIGKHSAFTTNNKVIHQACKEIADMNGYDLTELYMNMMKKCLPSITYNLPSEDETVVLNVNTDFSKTDIEDETNLQRVTHLLQQGSLEDNALQLLNIALKETSVSSGHRSRALCCLFSIIDPDTLSTLSGYSSIALWDLLKSLHCLAELESVHIPHTIESFHKCDKTELVESILTFNGHYCKALQFAASICLEYKIWKKSLWSAILRNMKEIGMFEELKELLKCLGCITSLWDCKEFVEAWKYILFSKFKNDNVSEENEAQFLEIFSMLLRCPCVMDIDLISLSEEFHIHNLTIPAAAVLLLLTDDKDNEIKEFFKRVSLESVQKEFDRLKRKGYNMIQFTQVYQYLIIKQRKLTCPENW